DRNRSHWSTSKTPSYTKSVSWQHHQDELSNIVLFPVKEDDPRNQVNFLYEPSERPYCHHASVRVDEKERQVRCKICGAVVEPFDWMLS
ncbi:hypothetical protein PSZ83_24140, partial [Shigella sonnei]|nr:hypothetical protein [Shigella sonnei]MDD0425258.1 hypothetical protein [Shigella sonnei]MDD0429619.1 hypothetical protein [Shigella sonnei]MDD0433770.1 hypothetical protein [Shigella sonnei]MDD0451906.1 hypothetical protein [Shigella sonnei]